MASNHCTSLTAAVLVLCLLLSTSTLSTNACGSTCKPPPGATASSCPVNTSKLGVCAGLLGAAKVVVGSPAYSQCCAVLGGLGEVEAAWCVCTAIKANVLGIELNLPIDVELILKSL